MKNNPMSFKPGGFANGAGHGITVKQTNGQYWHFATVALASNSHWERRLSMFPTYFDEEGLMYSNTSYGDYPLFGPDHPTKAGQHNGWMLLSYKGNATVSSSKKQVRKSTSTDGDFDITEMPLKKNKQGEIISKLLTDESTKSFWVAEANDDKQWVKIEMLSPGNIYAFQLNFHDEESAIYIRTEGLRHRFTLEVSEDGKNWKTVVDRSKSFKDSPNAYLPLNQPVRGKFVRYKNLEVPGNNLALSEIRVVGKGVGKQPGRVKGFKVNRQIERRDASFTWEPVQGAQGYNIRWGIAPDKLYHSWLLYDVNEHFMRNLDRDTQYYFSIEAFNENGVPEKTQVQEVK